MKKITAFLLILQIGIIAAFAQPGPQVKTANGTVEGITDANGIRIFMGIPFAQPPVGDLRWKEPPILVRRPCKKECSPTWFSAQQAPVKTACT
jgi:para-nitrobenzyl esterase